MNNISIVDDEDKISTLLKRILSLEGFELNSDLTQINMICTNKKFLKQFLLQ